MRSPFHTARAFTVLLRPPSKATQAEPFHRATRRQLVQAAPPAVLWNRPPAMRSPFHTAKVETRELKPPSKATQAEPFHRAIFLQLAQPAREVNCPPIIKSPFQIVMPSTHVFISCIPDESKLDQVEPSHLAIPLQLLVHVPAVSKFPPATSFPSQTVTMKG